LNHIQSHFTSIEAFHAKCQSIREEGNPVLEPKEQRLLDLQDFDFKRNMKTVAKLRGLIRNKNPIVITEEHRFKENGELDEHSFPIDEDIYVHALMLPPGSHNFSIRVEEEFNIVTEDDIGSVSGISKQSKVTSNSRNSMMESVSGFPSKVSGSEVPKVGLIELRPPVNNMG
jgi:hypothetical protein